MTAKATAKHRKKASASATKSKKLPSATKPAAANEQPAAAPAQTKLPGAFSLFDPSIKALKVNPGAILGLFFTPFLAITPFILLLGLAIARLTIDRSGHVKGSIALAVWSLILYMVFGLFIVIVASGITVATLKSVRGEKTTYGRAFMHGLYFFWRYVGLVIVVGLLVIGGLILLIVPGVFVLKRYFLSFFYLVDRDIGIREAMRQSAADTKRLGGVWGLIGVLVLIDLLGLIPYLGWVLSMLLGVLYLAAPAVRYLQITEAAQAPVASDDKK